MHQIQYLLYRLQLKKSTPINIQCMIRHQQRKHKVTTQIFAVNILQRVNEPEQEETDQRFMTLFPDLNLEALRVAADTLVPRFIIAIPKIVTKITSEVNNVSSSAELTQVV
ncbi:Hypothetical_protein [Hexamita inflata]|uniref:Hypothetical_protein n=1 Tax=Hexamita inflata TaxID=28002 RepID=A0AA86UKX8_9EUKA|nr:Hypothetical protein HINF_LOCUS42902 [Hexamita inflata]